MFKRIILIALFTGSSSLKSMDFTEYLRQHTAITLVYCVAGAVIADSAYRTVSALRDCRRTLRTQAAQKQEHALAANNRQNPAPTGSAHARLLQRSQSSNSRQNRSQNGLPLEQIIVEKS